MSNLSPSERLNMLAYQQLKSWFVAYTMVAAEAKAERDVREAGFEAFAPTITKTVIKHGRRRDLLEPVFPRYIFVCFDRERDDWGLIQELRHIQFIIRNNMMPAKVPTIVVDRLKRATDAGVFSSKSALVDGDSVEIEEGPFRDLIGKVKSASPRKRVKVLLNILGRDTTVDIDACFLKKIR